jgi:hypothetical protein
MPASAIVKIPRSREWRDRIGGVTAAYFWNETFGFGVLVFWPINFAQFGTLMRHYGAATKAELAELGGTEIRSGQYFFFPRKETHVIAFSKREHQARDVGVIAHEAFHCVRNALRRRAITTDGGDGEEAHAYALGWLTNRITEARGIMPIRDFSK